MQRGAAMRTALLGAVAALENRDWRPRNPALRFRGTCLIHTGIALQPISDELRAWVGQTSGVDLPRSDEPPRGGIVGQVDIIDVVGASSSPWFERPCGLVLANPKLLSFSACRGRLGFFEISRSSGVPMAYLDRSCSLMIFAKLLIYLAPRAGFEPATNRLTAGCSTAELPGNSSMRWTRITKPGRF